MKAAGEKKGKRAWGWPGNTAATREKWIIAKWPCSPRWATAITARWWTPACTFPRIGATTPDAARRPGSPKTRGLSRPSANWPGRSLNTSPPWLILISSAPTAFTGTTPNWPAALTGPGTCTCLTYIPTRPYTFPARNCMSLPAKALGDGHRKS